VPRHDEASLSRRSLLTIPAATLATRVLLFGAKTAANRQPFGSLPDGTAISLYTLANRRGMEARVMTYGATLVSLKTPDRDGKPADVTLGFDSLDGYLRQNPFFGATVGRYANRIGKARFALNGVEHKLPANNGENCLHGGLRGFDKRVWKEVAATGESVELSYESADGEEGFPGKLTTRITYTLTRANELRLDYHATAAQDTVLNLTNHSYFNLSGATSSEAAGDILGHRIQIRADRFTPTDAGQIPTGELRPVAGTPLDFRTLRFIGARIDSNDENIRIGKGYDHNYVLNGASNAAPGKVNPCARVEDPHSGRVMEVLTTQPGVQFYTANNLSATLRGKGGKAYSPRSAFCLETQHFPDSPNHPDFPSTVLRAGRSFSATTIYRFSARK
jgi:aldose 1-epimerase